MNMGKTMNKKIFFDILYVLMIMGLLLFMYGTYTFFQSEGKDCLKDPLVYYQEETETFCTCIAYDFSLKGGVS